MCLLFPKNSGCLGVNSDPQVFRVFPDPRTQGFSCFLSQFSRVFPGPSSRYDFSADSQVFRLLQVSWNFLQTSLESLGISQRSPGFSRYPTRLFGFPVGLKVFGFSPLTTQIVSKLPFLFRHVYTAVSFQSNEYDWRLAILGDFN